MEESKFETLISVISSMWGDRRLLSLSEKNLKVLCERLDLNVEYSQLTAMSYDKKNLNSKEFANRYKTDIYIERIEILTGFLRDFANMADRYKDFKIQEKTIRLEKLERQNLSNQSYYSVKFFHKHVSEFIKSRTTIYEAIAEGIIVKQIRDDRKIRISDLEFLKYIKKYYPDKHLALHRKIMEV